MALIGLMLQAACASAAPGTIGAALGQKNDHRLFVRAVPAGQGADRAGLAVDDEILAIDGKDVHTMSQDDVRRAVRGAVDTVVVVTIARSRSTAGGSAEAETARETRDVKIVRTPLLAEEKPR